jgi:hypothetical protein
VTDEIIRLTVSPQGIESATPSTTVLSIVTDSHCTTGPQGSFCGRIHFFASEEVAAQWSSTYADIAVFTLDEAYQIAYALYIEPVLKYS